MTDLQPLLNIGAVGVILAWFMLRMEPRMKAMEDALNRFSRVQLLDMVSRSDAPPAVREQAQTILNEMRPVGPVT